jgi:uncharacterized membrane protein
MEIISSSIGTVVVGIEVLAVVIILLAMANGTVIYALHPLLEDAYTVYKQRLGKGLLLGLELLIAADIIRTVALEPTLANVATLALIVLVRTFLSWSIIVEIEGHWPWQK